MDQADLFDVEAARSMLDQLLDDSRLYRKGADYQNLLDFVVRLRNFAPFNAMLLQVQKPGMRHAASKLDWLGKFGRTIKDDARPLLILWPFAPIALVYDLLDTEGEDLLEGVAAFEASGTIDQLSMGTFALLLIRKGIEWTPIDVGENRAGSIQLVQRAAKPGAASTYRMKVNRNHDLNIQFATLTHELAHLYMGHLGPDSYLHIPVRPAKTLEQRELEAESVAYIVCGRNGVDNKSQSYLASYVKQDTSAEQLDIYQIMRAAGQIETLLGLAAHTKLDKPKTRII